MSIPTVTAVTPAAGPTRGRNIVRVAGSNFRLPPPPPPSGYVGGEQQRTVSVRFGGVACEWAYAASATLILARVPEWAGTYDVTFPLAVDVRVANLDDAGVEIPTENATKLNAYAYGQPDLARESYLQRVCRGVLRLFRRHVLKATHIVAKRDYDDDPSSEARAVEATPVVHLIGPTLPINRPYSVNREEPEDDPSNPGGFLRRNVPVTVDLEFEVVIWARTSMQLLALQQAVLMLFRDVTHLVVARDPAQPSLGAVQYEFAMPWEGFPSIDAVPNQADLCSARSRCIVRGVHVDDEIGTIIERGWLVTSDPAVDVQRR